MTAIGLSTRGQWRRVSTILGHTGLLPAAMAAIVIAMFVVEPAFLRFENLVGIAREFAFIVMVALGQGVVIICGAIDLSVGAIVALSSVIAATTMSALADGGMESAVGIGVLGSVAGLASGIFAGGVNGLLISRFKVDPFVVTIGTSAMILGTIFYMTYGIPVYGVPDVMTEILGRGRILWLPVVFWTSLALIAVFWTMMSFSIVGRHIYALGGNAVAARAAGIKGGRLLVFAFAQAGALAALAGLFYTARLGSGQAALGAATTMQSISAAVIGGVALHGGRGRILRIALGALLLDMVQNALILARVDSKWQMAVFGLILIVAAAIERHSLAEAGH